MSGQVRGSAGGLEKLSAGVSGLVKKPLDCTVHGMCCAFCRCQERLYRNSALPSTGAG